LTPSALIHDIDDGDAEFAQSEFEMSSRDFKQIAATLHAESGIFIPESKTALVYSRLAKRLRALRLQSFRDYCSLIASEDGVQERQQMIAALTTNVTAFLREPHHFEHLKTVVAPPLIAAAQRGERVRLWSSACSSGEEPYSIAMTVLESLPELRYWDVRILATDLDSEVLERARRGLYPDERLKNVSEEQRARYFIEHTTRDGLAYEAGPELKALITFKQLNLMHSLPMRGPLQAVFCRNVVIYFDKETQRNLFARISQLQRAGDLLFLGHSESLFKVTEDYSLIGKTVYRRA
jgi:chemotaxis protein methyltransferase CheR